MRPRKAWIEARLADLRQQFPYPPPKFATITVVLDEPATVTLPLTYVEKLRPLFLGHSDDEILTVIVEEFLERFGLLEAP